MTRDSDLLLLVETDLWYRSAHVLLKVNPVDCNVAQRCKSSHLAILWARIRRGLTAGRPAAAAKIEISNPSHHRYRPLEKC